jgi:hypothetical protein
MGTLLKIIKPCPIKTEGKRTEQTSNGGSQI